MPCLRIIGKCININTAVRRGLLTILFTWIFLFVLFWICVCNSTLLLTVFFLYLLFLLIRILLLRPYESILKTLDSYQNHDD
ncbi:hypothetical protein RIF29_43192 [Crotalaria pallida]|uniref:Uncharacterized protein n=1 Tax=Crotalaria pallida TaxID=3830 RepID=A0AAN9E3F5_CROPI